MERAIRKSAKTFQDMTVQQRIEALISGTCNNFGKALALYVMERGKSYTREELDDAAADFLKMDLPYVGTYALSAYLDFSLLPIGFVAEKKVVRDAGRSSRRITAYEITDDGARYGKPGIERSILISNYMRIPLHVINGAANTGMHGALSHGYAVAMVLGALSDGDVHAQREISRSAGISTQTTYNALRKLTQIGLVAYENTKADASGASESAKSGVRLLEDGQICDAFAYGPIRCICENPASSSVYAEYRNVFSDRSEVIAAFQAEMRRFADTSSHLHRQSATDSAALVLDAIKKTGLSRFRRKDVLEALKNGDDNRDPGNLVSHFMRILRDNGTIIPVGQTYYELTEPEQKDKPA